MKIRINNISRHYGEVEALKNISLEIQKGELFGFIGPDGAGKTTLFRIIVTLLKPDSGNVKINGLDTIKDYKEIRKIVGYMPGRFSLYQDLTVEENLNFYASIFGTTVQENYHLIKDIYSHIEPYKKRLAGKLSGGMKQKLALSCAMIHRPEILVLDEPTTGVDAVSRKEFWEMLKNLKESGITIIVSTPYMDEAAKCDRVALIQQGKIMAIDQPDNIVKEFKSELLSISADNNYQLLNILRQFPRTESVFPFGQSVHYTEKGGQIQSVEEIISYLEKNGISNLKIEKINAGIEDCFMKLMNEENNYFGGGMNSPSINGTL
ncbi:MAG TPA: ABC transporter ATP-binding protein [Bacteroidia bacterium]|nr:ABC transporter ATP-binding protein [Bacteroidia bacterium]HRS58905.1 ABC transporter ATP-binding protein [Bacteroidia bacterium]HRU67401.1 ABC transporter ATP-binding protein [Bacteroidia bacterium]